MYNLQAATAVDTIKASPKSGALFVFVLNSFAFRGMHIFMVSGILPRIVLFYAFRLV